MMACLPAIAADDFAVGPVVAKGKDFQIRRSQVDDAFVTFRAKLAARGQSIPEAKRETTEAQLLDHLIVTHLLVNKATAADKESAKTNAAKYIERSREELGSDEALRRHARSIGLSMVRFTNETLSQAISQEVVTREVKNKIAISEEQMKIFWETNDAAFRQPEMARASHILFTTKDFAKDAPLSEADKKAKKAKAEAVLERARKGEDFTALATTFSEDPRVKDNKGEYKFTRAKDDPRNAMMPEFETAAFGLLTNQVSDIVTTSFGYHIIKLHEIIPARKVPFAEARGSIKEFMEQSELERRMPAFFAQMKKEAGVEILDDKLKAALEKVEQERAAN